MDKKRFLIVEDELIVALNLTKTLQRLGYDVICSIPSGEAAIEQVFQTKPDLILMDIHLKGEIDGIEAAEHIHALSDVPIIFLTAYNDEPTIQRAIQTKSYGYLVKPFQEFQLSIAIQVSLNKIEEKRSRENELLQQIEHEKELRQLKSQFVSMVSHEFKTPLSTILVSIDLIQKYGDTASPKKKTELINRIKLSVNNMTELLEDVLLIGRTEAERLGFNPSSIDIVDYFQNLVVEMQLSTTSTHIIEFSPQINHLFVDFDERLMRVAISNLLSNAVKYSPGCEFVHFELSVTANNLVVIVIKDNGIGIPKKNMECLFLPFDRAENVGNIEGTGLGLFITNMIVELHGGHIIVESEEGEGTSFMILMPINSRNAED